MKHSRRLVLALVVLAVFFFLLRWDHYGPMAASADRKEAGPSYQERLGAATYQYYCETCHGADGKGDGFNAFNLDPKPPDFSSSTFQQMRTDEQLAAVIAGGGPSVGRSAGMPPWGQTLSSRELRAVLLHVRRLSVSSAGAPAAGSSK